MAAERPHDRQSRRPPFVDPEHDPHNNVDPAVLYQLIFGGVPPYGARSLIAAFDIESVDDLEKIPADVEFLMTIEDIGHRSAVDAIEVAGKEPILPESPESAARQRQ